MDQYFYVTTTQSARIQEEEESFQDKLITTVCRLMSINRDLLGEQCRRPHIVNARRMIWEIMIAIRGYSLKEAGRIFNNDHTTVLHGLNQFVQDLQRDELLTAVYRQLLERMGIDMEQIYDLRNRREINRLDRLSRSPQIHV